jgi:TolA-binding protein
MLLSALVLTAALSPQAPPPTAPAEVTPATSASTSAEPSPGVKSTDMASGGSSAGDVAAGLAAYRKRKFAAAADAFRKAVAADPSSAAAHYYLGYSIYKQAEKKVRNSPGKQQAAEEFAKAYSLDPAFRPTWGVARK